MRAITCPATGSLDNLKTTDVPEPQQAPKQFTIAVRAAALNYADVMMVLGMYQEKPPLPFVPGMEVAGEVIHSPEGSAYPPGSRVMATLGHGGLAEFAVANEADVLPVPHKMDWAAAASFPLVYGTAHLGLTHRASMSEDTLLIVTGAGGGLGLATIDVGKALGAEVVAVTSGGAKSAAAQSRGADHVVNHRTEDVRARLKELGKGRRQLFFDSVGGAAFETCLRAAAPGSRLMVVGFAGGDIQSIPANILLVKNISVIGYYWAPTGPSRSISWKIPFHSCSTWLLPVASTPGPRRPSPSTGRGTH